MSKGIVYCTNLDHGPGEHNQSCIPAADPTNPELRLIRAIWGLCPECDRTDEHEHTPDPLPAGIRFRARIAGYGLSDVEYEIIEFVRVVHGDNVYLAAPVGGGIRAYHAESGMEITS